LLLKYEAVKAKADAGTAGMDDVAPFDMYAYWAKADDAVRYKAMFDSVKQAVGDLGNRRKAPRRSAGAGGGAASSADDSAVRSALAMFS
jgi:hypothetical protein